MTFPVTFATVAVVLGAALVVAAAAGLFAWKRRGRAVASVVRSSVVRELERDPALSGLMLKVATRTPWTGGTQLSLAGVVPSPWYRYAVMRAAARAVAQLHQPVLVIDRIAIADRRATSRRSA
jgi:hypothetical protein